MGGGVSSNTNNVTGRRESRLPWRRNRHQTAGGVGTLGAVAENDGEVELSEPPPVAPLQLLPSIAATDVSIALVSASLSSTVVVDADHPRMSLALLVSPRQEASLRSSVPYTPKCGPDAHTYKYYCPLCMEHFAGIFKSKCCGNYTCLGCTTDYLGAKGLEATTANEILRNSEALKHIPCPHCFTTGFNPMIVNSEEEIRDYKGTATKSKLTISPRAAATSGGIAFNDGRSRTPLKVGDTFEDLKRKMVPFAAAKVASAEGEKIKSVLLNHDKENRKNCESAVMGVRISPRMALQQSSSHHASYAVGDSSGNRNNNYNSNNNNSSSNNNNNNNNNYYDSTNTSSSSNQEIALSPMFEPATTSSSSNGVMWSCPTGRRTVRLGVAQSTGTFFPSAATSPLSVGVAPVGRNLFEEVSAEGAGVMGDSDPASDDVDDSQVDVIDPGLVETLSTLLLSGMKMGGEVGGMSTFTLTPRTRGAMARVASVLVEEIMEQAVGRQNEMERIEV